MLFESLNDDYPTQLCLISKRTTAAKVSLERILIDPSEEFKEEVSRNIARLAQDRDIRALSRTWLRQASAHKYSYNFACMGRPIIQLPQDIVAIQELIWKIRPDLIIETGIAHGGSLVLSASTLAMLDYCDAIEVGTPIDPRVAWRRVLGIDIDIRSHNRAAIEAHPMAHRIDMIQGSSISEKVVDQVRQIARKHETVLVLLDSNHTHDHVLAELEAYAPLVSKHSYCVVFDTVIEDLPDELFADRQWGKGKNPKSAVREYLRRLKEDGRIAEDGAPLAFEIDKTIEHKLLITSVPDGYLKRVLA